MAGVADVAKRAWDLTSVPGNIATNLPIVQPGAVYVYPFETGVHMKPNAAVFGDAFTSSRTSAYAYALLQNALKAVEATRDELARKPSGDVVSCSQPIRMFLEPLREDAAVAAARVGAANEDETRSPFGDVHANASRDAPVANGAESLYGIDPAERQFMRGVPDYVRIVGYRLWIFVMPAGVEIDKHVLRLVADAKREYASVTANASGGTASGGSNFAAHTTGGRRWMLLRHENVLAMACDSAVGVRNLTQPAVMARINDPTLRYAENPVKPRLAFDPAYVVPRACVRACAEQRTLARYMNEAGDYTFAFPDSVIEVPAHEQTAVRLCSYMLPDFQARRVRPEALRAHLGRHDRAAPPAPVVVAPADDVFAARSDELRRTAYGDTYSAASATAFDYELLHREEYDSVDVDRSRLHGRASAALSPLHALHYEGAELRERAETCAVRAGWSRAQRRATLVANQRHLLEVMERTCLAPDAGISRPSDALNAWLVTRDLAADGSWLGERRPLLDARLSLMGSFTATLRMRLETAGFVATAHSAVFDALMCAGDAYNMDKSLHLHNVYAGPPSVSKSFILKFLQGALVTGTTLWLSDITENTFNVDELMLHLIVLWDEVKPKYMNAERGATTGGDFESVLKMILDSCVASKLSVMIDKDAREKQRRSQMSYSEVIGVFFWTTNHPRSWLAKAMDDRVLFTNFTEHVRPGRSPEHLIGIEERLPVLEREQVRVFRRQVQTFQFAHYVTEMCIHVEIFPDVTLAVTDASIHIAVAVARARHVELRTRTVGKLRRYVRKLVITHAWELLYSLPASRYYGRDFEVASLRHLGELLHDNSEMFEYTLQALAGQIIEEEASAIISTVLKLALDRANRPAIECYYNARTVLGTARPPTVDAGADDESSSSSSSALPATAPLSTARKHTSSTSMPSSSPLVASSYETPRKENYFWQYYSFDRSFSEFAQLVADSTDDKPTRFSRTQIMQAMARLRRKKLVSRRYAISALATSNTNHAGLRVDISAGTSAIPILFEEGGLLFVAIEFANTQANVIDDIIAATRTEYTKPAHYVTAKQLDARSPQLLAVERTTAPPKVRMEYYNAATARRREASAVFSSIDERAFTDTDTQRGGLEYDKHARRWYYAESLDRYSARVRARALFLDEELDSAFGGRCDFESLEAYARREYVLEPRRTYPDWWRRRRPRVPAPDNTGTNTAETLTEDDDNDYDEYDVYSDDDDDDDDDDGDQDSEHLDRTDDDDEYRNKKDDDDNYDDESEETRVPPPPPPLAQFDVSSSFSSSSSSSSSNSSSKRSLGNDDSSFIF